MLIQLPDDVALRYQQAAERARVPLATYLARHLQRFAEVPSGARALVLTGDALERVDALLGLGSTASPQAFIQAVEGWAGITIGGVRVDFSPAQLEEIAHRAEKQGKTPQEIVEGIVADLSKDFFYAPVVAR